MLETERLSLKVLRRDKEALRQLATIEGEAVAVVVRRLIRKAVRERGLLPVPTDQSQNDADDRQGVQYGD